MNYLLLDIDGTILPAYTDDASRETLTITLNFNENGIPLTFYADVIEKLNEISQGPNCEIVMCTSWNENSLEIAKLLGIKSESYLSFVQTNPKLWYKWESILDFCKLHPEDKIILCDDLASRANTQQKPKNLIKIFQPNPAKGLTMRDLTRISRLINRY